MPFLPPNQQHQSSEGILTAMLIVCSPYPADVPLSLASLKAGTYLKLSDTKNNKDAANWMLFSLQADRS